MEELIPRLGQNIIKLIEVDSTNTYATNLVSKTNPINGTVIRAEYQTKGRGQIGRYWNSAPNLNLLCSVILFPSSILVSDQFMISKVVSIAIAQLLEEYDIEDVKIKWPNDIYVKDRKIAGVLIQNQIQGKSIKNSIIGVGINVNQLIWNIDIPNPTSISKITQKKHDIDNVLNDLLNNLSKYYYMLLYGKHEAIDELYIRSLYLINSLHTFYQGDATFNGAILGVNTNGQLLIRKSDQSISSYSFREISFSRHIL